MGVEELEDTDRPNTDMSVCGLQTSSSFRFSHRHFCSCSVAVCFVNSGVGRVITSQLVSVWCFDTGSGSVSSCLLHLITQSTTLRPLLPFLRAVSSGSRFRLTVTTLIRSRFPPWRIMLTTCLWPTFTTFSWFTCEKHDTAAER